MTHWPEILLILFIVNLGMASGAGIYETKIVIPLWFRKSTGVGYSVNTAAMHELDTGRKFWVFVTTVPLTLLTLTNLVLAWQSQSSMHDWWLAAVLVTLIERIGTFTFFIPTAIALQKADSLPASRVSRLARLWIGSNYIRNGLNLIALIFALLALSV